MASGCGLQQGGTEEIVNNLVQAGYPINDIMIVDGQVWVGRDAHVTLQASREMLEIVPGSSEEQYRTTNLVSSTKTKICINPTSAFNSYSRLSQGLDLAIANYNALNLWFDLARGPTTGCSANITAQTMSGTGGLAGFPSGGNPYGTINIGTGLQSYGVDVNEHVITHELGHCVGLRHSDYYNRSISCGTGGDEGSAGVGAIHIAGTPTTATVGGSIMNACFRSTETGEFTSSDVVALETLYFSSSDIVQPTTSITAPAAGSTVQGTVTVSAVASDNVAVTRVEFYAGSTFIAQDTSEPYAASWNTTSWPNGSVTLTSRAYDAAGNNRTSTGVVVTVANPTCVLSFSKANVASGDSVLFSLISGGPIPPGSLAYLYGSKDGVTDENGTFATATTFSSEIVNTFDLAGSYLRYMIIRAPNGVEVCSTNTVTTYFEPPLCWLSFSRSIVPSGESVQFTLFSQGDIPSGSLSYLYGTKNGISDENGSFTAPTEFDYTIVNAPGLAGSYIRWMSLRAPDGRTVCQTNSTSTVFQ